MYQREGVFTNTKVLLHLSIDFNLRPEAPDKLFFPRRGTLHKMSKSAYDMIF